MLGQYLSGSSEVTWPCSHHLYAAFFCLEFCHELLIHPYSSTQSSWHFHYLNYLHSDHMPQQRQTVKLPFVTCGVSYRVLHVRPLSAKDDILLALKKPGRCLKNVLDDTELFLVAKSKLWIPVKWCFVTYTGQKNVDKCKVMYIRRATLTINIVMKSVQIYGGAVLTLHVIRSWEKKGRPRKL